VYIEECLSQGQLFHPLLNSGNIIRREWSLIGNIVTRPPLYRRTFLLRNLVKRCDFRSIS